MHNIISTIKEEDFPALGHVLAKAFSNERFARWLIPSDRDWGNRAQLFFEYHMFNTMREGKVFTTVDKNCAALCLTPDNPYSGVMTNVLLPLQLMMTLRSKAVSAWQAYAQFTSHRPKEKHWYIEILGVDPLSQRRGIGQALVEHIMEKAAGFPIYLETSNLRNIEFYKKFGFVIHDELNILDCPKMWSMMKTC